MVNEVRNGNCSLSDYRSRGRLIRVDEYFQPLEIFKSEQKVWSDRIIPFNSSGCVKLSLSQFLN